MDFDIDSFLEDIERSVVETTPKTEKASGSESHLEIPVPKPPALFRPSVLRNQAPAGAARPPSVNVRTSTSITAAPTPATAAGAKQDPNKPAEGIGSRKGIDGENVVLRSAMGKVWKDEKLAEFGLDDYRIFCGNLGAEVSDEMLAKSFGHYPSLQLARVVQNKQSKKSLGYGFISFREPADFLDALRTMNGKYCGSRPMQLKRSKWEERSVVNPDNKSRKRLLAPLVTQTSKHIKR